MTGYLCLCTRRLFLLLLSLSLSCAENPAEKKSDPGDLTTESSEAPESTESTEIRRDVAIQQFAAADNSQVTFTLNIDFYDQVERFQFLNARVGATAAERSMIVYPRSTYETMLRKAVDSGFRRFYFRVSNVGTTVFTSQYKSIAPILHPTINAWVPMDPISVTLDFIKKLRVETGKQLEVFIWMTPFDDAGDDDPGQAISRQKFQSDFSKLHPEYQLLSREGAAEINAAAAQLAAAQNSEERAAANDLKLRVTERHPPLWGAYCFGYEQVRYYWDAQVNEIVSRYANVAPIAGFFFDDRTHANKGLEKKHYGFNKPVIDRYKAENNGADPLLRYDLKELSRIHGEFYTEYVAALSARLRRESMKIHVKASWSNHYLAPDRLGSLYKSLFATDDWIRRGLVDSLIIGGDTATSESDEFAIENIDTFSPINNLKSFPAGTNSVDRWITLFDWRFRDLNKNSRRLEGQTMTEPKLYRALATKAVIQKAVAAIINSGVNGIVVHEAFLIDENNDWDFFAQLTCRKIDQVNPIDTDSDGIADCRECSVGAIGCAEAHSNSQRDQIEAAYQTAWGRSPAERELTSWLPSFKARTESQETLTGRLANDRAASVSTFERAFNHATGLMLSISALADRTDGNDTNPQIYRQIFDAIVLQEVSRGMHGTPGALVNRAFHEVRGQTFPDPPPQPTSIGIFSSIAHRNGYKALVQEFKKELAVWSERDLDGIVHKAYQKVRATNAGTNQLRNWRPLLRQGFATYKSIEMSVLIANAYFDAKGVESSMDENAAWLEFFYLGKMTQTDLKRELLAAIKRNAATDSSDQIGVITKRAYKSALNRDPSIQELAFWKGKFGIDGVGFAEIARDPDRRW